MTLIVLASGTTILGLWIQRSVTAAVVERTAGVTALYIDSLVSPLVQELATETRLDEHSQAALDALLTETALSSQIVSVKIWALDGEILYSPNRSLIGQSFPVDQGMARAIRGEVVSVLSSLDREENRYERAHWDSLIETYAPVRQVGTDTVIAVSEF